MREMLLRRVCACKLSPRDVGCQTSLITEPRSPSRRARLYIFKARKKEEVLRPVGRAPQPAERILCQFSILNLSAIIVDGYNPPPPCSTPR